MSAQRKKAKTLPPLRQKFVTTSLRPEARTALHRAANKLSGELGRRVTASEALLAMTEIADWKAVAEAVESYR